MGCLARIMVDKNKQPLGREQDAPTAIPRNKNNYNAPPNNVEIFDRRSLQWFLEKSYEIYELFLQKSEFILASYCQNSFGKFTYFSSTCV